MEKKIENLIWVLVALVSVVGAVAIIVSILFGGHYYSGTYGPYEMMGGFYGMGIIMPVIGVISVIFVLIFIYFIFESIGASNRNHGSAYNGRAEEIAKERFAKGEISEQEYRNLMDKIRGQ